VGVGVGVRVRVGVRSKWKVGSLRAPHGKSLMGLAGCAVRSLRSFFASGLTLSGALMRKHAPDLIRLSAHRAASTKGQSQRQMQRAASEEKYKCSPQTRERPDHTAR
jgi:hypothetical protein